MILMDILERMTQIEDSGVLKFTPGPFAIKVSERDASAARLLMWLYEQENLWDRPVKDLFDILDSARWWARFFASIPPEVNSESGEVTS